MKTWQSASLSAIVGILVFLLLFPFSGDDSEPPTFYSVFSNEVPTGNPLLAVAAAVVAAGVTWMLTRRSRRP